MKSTALLTGPYDWDPELVPLAEFEARLAAVHRVLAEQGATALLLHGHSVDHGALAYLTGFVPKLGPAFALVPLVGPIRILASGGPGMVSSAKRLTWVEDVRPLSNLKNSLNDWFVPILPEGRARLGLWGGNIMAQRPYSAVAEAIQPFGKLFDLDDPLDVLRRRKSPLELKLLREACRILSAARDSFERAAADGLGARSAALAAERAAYSNGAQDVRNLASRKNGGPPLAFDGPDDFRVAPLLACFAVRFAGYWAEGLVTASSSHSGALARARATLTAMLREARPGATSHNLIRIAAEHLPPYKLHPFVASALGNGIGLSFEESPIFGRDELAKFEEGGVYTLRCGAMGDGGDNALVSAMAAVSGTGIDVLWPPELSRDEENTKGSR